MGWTPIRLTSKQVEERRRAGGRLLRAGKLSPAEIARQLGVSRAAVSQWAQRLASGGTRALRQRKPTGREPRLTVEKKRTLLRLLRRGAQAAGFPTERWAMGRVQQIIRREFGVVYHVNYLNRLLAKLGWSRQQPLPRAQERDEELIRAWLAKDWTRIKKGAAARRKHSVL